ncbi:MAG: glycosyltransferase family 39 protein [bacterium]|nr:glycosyltransferase family 39 protein [bacterium]
MKKPKNIFIFLALLFLFTRLYNLTLLPIFTDESIYLFWAKFIATHHSNWFMSLTDGKPPLFIWIITIFLKIFPSSMYLFAGRFVSVFAGGVALVGIYKLSIFLFKSKKTGVIAVLLGILSPFMLFHDRMALFDSFLSATLIWSVYFAFRSSTFEKKKDVFLWGLFLGLGLLIKSPAIIFLFLTPICFFMLAYKKNANFKKLFLLPFFPIAIAWIMYSIQKLSVNYRLVDIKNQQFQLPLEKLISEPFVLFFSNMKELLNWIIAYYTFPIFLIGILGLVFLLWKDFRKGLILLLLWIFPIIIFAFVGKILFPRYILFTTPYFIIACAEIIRRLNFNKVIIIIILLLSLQFDFYLLTKPELAPLPTVDHNQYVSSQYSGYGLNSIFKFLDKELDTGPRITLVTQGKFGLFPYAFMLKYWNDSRITIIQSWIPEHMEYNLQALQQSAKVYVVFKDTETVPAGFSLRLVTKGEKPGGKYPILLTTLK